ncbi:polynucleotide kinase 3 phosphatase-domain-containing protein [Peziza echinospora]|nr:polynucleotide kinase 3 phosphatase-domain-containing protein [Peziza echinospora]
MFVNRVRTCNPEGILPALNLFKYPISNDRFIALFSTDSATMASKRKAQDISPPAVKRSVKVTVQSTTTSATVTNFFKPLSEKEPEKTTWRVIDKSLLVAKYSSTTAAAPNYSIPRKVASFDLDSTLILTSSGNVHAKSASDWKWWNPLVPDRLKELYSQGYLITIFTNQGGLSLEKGGTKLDNFKLKVAAILSTLDIPLILYGATTNDHFRKPRTGMWNELAEEYDFDVHGVDKDASFLVGDAAGRDGDFSASDRYFANNVGIKFHTPEEHFLGQPARPMKDAFDPAAIIAAGSTATSPNEDEAFSKTADVELVLLVGSPGSGKSSYARRHLAPLGYERVNQDLLKTRPKCLKAASEFLEAKKCVAVDNTNPDVETRKIWIDLAKSYSVPIRCIYVTTPSKVCEHNDAVRAFGGDVVNPEHRKVLPRIAFAGYNSRFKEPTLAEGFTDITKINFKWEGTDAEREIWTRWWI